MKWMPLVKEQDVVEGGPAAMGQVGKRTIGVFRRGGKLYAVLDFCPHAGAPVCQGHVTGRVLLNESGQPDYNGDALTLRCPWHHWEFDLATGSAVADIREKIKVYPTRVRNGQIEVEM